MSNNLDIIIPIFNAYEELKNCIDSIKQYTDLSCNRLLLLNDCSTDPQVEKYLEAQENANIIVINNKKNVGYSANINQGLNYSKRDVILLNSDTIVTQYWIEKIIKCAYSNKKIATVTPLSNNATICSIPNVCEENQIPKGYSIDAFAKFVEEHSLRQFPEIPTAHGYCMFIKRNVIESIGVLDAYTFEKGYGEENDFCYRASEKGFCHVMCDDTFIYHKGTSSFLSEEKKRYIEIHSEILYQRYPECFLKTNYYNIIHQNLIVYNNIKIQIMLNNGKKNILLFFQAADIDHIDDSENNQTNLINEYIHYIKEKINVFTICQKGNYYVISGYSSEVDFNVDMDLSYKVNICKDSDYFFLLNFLRISLVCYIEFPELACQICNVLKTIKIPTIDFLTETKTSWKCKSEGKKIIHIKSYDDCLKCIFKLLYKKKNWVSVSEKQILQFYEILHLGASKINMRNVILLAERYKNEAISNWEVAEKYKNEAISNWEVAERYKNEAISNWEVADQYKQAAANNWEKVEELKKKMKNC